MKNPNIKYYKIPSKFQFPKSQKRTTRFCKISTEVINKNAGMIKSHENLDVLVV